MSRNEILKKFRENEDLIEERLQNGIENYRKGKICISVTDKSGNPVKNAKLKINQIKHEFKYGANIFMLDEFESEEKNEKYKKYFVDAFNMATLPFYWDALEP